MITFHIYIFLFISSKWQWAGYIVRRKQSSTTETADRLANLRTSTNKMTDGFPVDANSFQPRQLDVYGRGVQQLTSIGWYDDYYNIPFHIRVHKERSTYDVVIEKKKFIYILFVNFLIWTRVHKRNVLIRSESLYSSVEQKYSGTSQHTEL